MKNNIDLVLLGDSLTKRGEWKTLLDKQNLINLGVDGDTTSGILKRIDTVISLKPKKVFFMAGINDLCVSVPLQEVFENYKRILELLKENGIYVMVQLTLVTQMPAVNKKVILFNELLKEYCEKNSIDILDLSSSFTNQNGLLKEELTTDGLHLGRNAYKAWAYKIKKLY